MQRVYILMDDVIIESGDRRYGRVHEKSSAYLESGRRRLGRFQWIRRGSFWKRTRLQLLSYSFNNLTKFLIHGSTYVSRNNIFSRNRLKLVVASGEPATRTIHNSKTVGSRLQNYLSWKRAARGPKSRAQTCFKQRQASSLSNTHTEYIRELFWWKEKCFETRHA